MNDNSLTEKYLLIFLIYGFCSTNFYKPSFLSVCYNDKTNVIVINEYYGKV